MAKKTVTPGRSAPDDIDLSKIYGSIPDHIEPDISLSTYSNLAMVQVTNRDVCIDFLQMPGIAKEEKVILNGVRIYMSFSAAQKLSKVLDRMLEEAYKQGEMEQYHIPES